MLGRDINVKAYLEAEWQLMDSCGKSSNLAVRQNARVIGVDLIKHLWHVQLLLSAHQEVEVWKGELHVFWVTHTVAWCFVKLLRESKKKKRAQNSLTCWLFIKKMHTKTRHSISYVSCSSCMMRRSIMCGMCAGTLRDVNPNWLLSSLLTYRRESAKVSRSLRPVAAPSASYISSFCRRSSSYGINANELIFKEIKIHKQSLKIQVALIYLK